MLTIITPQTAQHLLDVQMLWEELLKWDQAMTTRAGFDPATLTEFYYAGQSTAPPGDYAPPNGWLLLALDGEQAAGTGAWHKLDAATCEIKRMYVQPAFRRKNIGGQLLDALVAKARRQHVKRMLLETANFMQDAHKLYYSRGFLHTHPY